MLFDNIARKLTVVRRVILSVLKSLLLPYSMRRFAFFAFSLVLSSSLLTGQITTAAVFGTVISIKGSISDLVLDSFRQRLYLVNSSTNQVNVFSTVTNQVITSVSVGKGPLAAAMSMDAGLLYVTNSTDKTLSVVDLGSLAVTQTIGMPATPEGVEVGLDGRVLISTQSTTAQTLLIFDPVQTAGQQLTVVLAPPPPSTPAPLPAQTLTRPQTQFTDKLIRTPDGQFIVGLTNPGTNGAQTYLFVYEVASGTILRSRTVAGQSTVFSMAPDGSRFMAGYTMYETSTLSVIAQQNNGNAPFPFAANFTIQVNIGGSVFSADGNTLYSAFNVQPFTGTNPPPRPNSSTLLIGDGKNLGINLGIRLPESIVSKMVILPSGAVYSLSASGMIYLPLQDLYNYPIIQPETTQIFLSLDPCSRAIASGSLRINNLGKGKLNYSVPNLNASLTTEVTTGVAPSSIRFTLDPGGRTANAVNRQSGTNLSTGGQTLQGTPVDVNISSSEAINIPNTIRVYMNVRDSDQRGIIYPIPTVPNNSPGASFNPTFAGGNEGVQDIVLDQPRNRVYLTNSGYNRIEVFDTIARKFLDPIPVGQLPHQMALATDGSTLYVGNTGGELISIVDLSQTPARITGTVNFPPIPRQASGTNTTLLNPRSLAYGLFGLEFVMSNGSQWKLATNNVATVRPVNPITPTIFATPTTMIAPPDGSSIFTLAGNGVGYLYDPLSDTYTALELLFPTTPAPVSGYFGPIAAGPQGSYYLAGGLTLNSSLNVLYGNANASNTQRNVYAQAPVDANNYVRFTTSFRTNIATSASDEQRPTLELFNVPSGQSTLLGVAAEQPRYTVFGTNRTNVPARQMVVDNTGTAFAVTLSGLSVIPLTINGAPRPQFAAARSVVNASDGTTTLRPGSFVNVSGAALADTATADVLPAPTVLGGSCVTFNDVSLPLFKTSGGQIQAQIPANVVVGDNVVVVRSLATGQASDPVVVKVLPGASN